MFQDVAKSRHLVGVAITLTMTGSDENGEPADPGTVTVAVTNSVGASVTSGAVAVSSNDRSTTIAAADNAAVDRLTAVWSSGGAVLATTHHDVVGGFYASLADIRSNTTLLEVRSEVEYQLDDACRRAFVPRFASETLSGSGRNVLQLAQGDLREVVSLEYWTGAAWADLAVTVAEIEPDSFGRAVLRRDVFPAGHKNLRVGYRYGLDRPPADLKRAVVKAVEARRAGDTSGIPSRAISVQGTELGNVVLATPGLGKWITAIPEIDEVINRYRRRDLGVGIS